MLILDSRGWINKMFEEDKAGFKAAQAGISFTYTKGTIRGMHKQNMDKLYCCLNNSIFDIQFDEDFNDRREHIIMPWQSIVVPGGYYHGFQTLENNTHLLFFCSELSAPETGLRYDDPALAIPWPLPVTNISDKDKSWKLWEGKK